MTKRTTKHPMTRPKMTWMHRRARTTARPLQLESLEARVMLTAEIGTKAFLNDIVDGQSSLEQLDLKVKGVQGSSHYSYKLGSESSTVCGDSAGWSAIASKKDPLLEDLSGFAVGDDLLLCVRGLKIKNGEVVTEQPFGEATEYRWERTTDLLPAAFNITAPSGTIAEDTPTATWEASDNAASYDVTVATDAACNVPVQTYPGLSTTSRELTLLSDGTYYTCVTAVNANGLTEASNNGLPFTIDTAVLPGAFDILGPTGVIADTTPTLNWSPSTDAIGYDVVITVDPEGNSIVRSGTTASTTFDVASALPPGTFYSFVTANNDDGSQDATNNGLAFTIIGAPGSFGILGPDGPSNNATPTIEWQASIAADDYDVVISSTSDCGSPVMTYENLTGTSQAVSPPLPDGTYFSCVTANNIAGTTNASNNGLPFLVDTQGPGDFQIVAPNFDTVLTATPVIKWTNSLGALSYDAFVATSPDCTGVVESTTTLEQEWQTPALVDGTYYACVNATDDLGNITMGETFDGDANLAFTIDTVSETGHVVWVSSGAFAISNSTQFPPPFGVVNSLQGADWHLTFQAFNSNRLTNWNGIDIVYKAIMSDSNEDAKDRLQVSGPVFNTTGELVATGAADLWDGSIVNSIQYDEFGNSVQNPEVWTGTFAVGISAGNHCGDWTGSGSGALYGNFTSTNAGWLDFGLRGCTGSAHIYGMSPPIALDAPAAFNITAPIDTIAESAPTVSWEQAAWAVSYDVTVANDESCSDVVQSYSNVGGAAQPLTSLDDGTYYTCVTANNPTGSTSATNNGLAFTIQSAPGSFEILSPTGTITETTPTVSWQAATAADSYDLSISSTPDCTSTVQSYPGLAGTSQTVSELASGTYYSCVTAQNAVGVTAADNQGLPFTVETASTTGHVVWVSSGPFAISNSTQFPPPFGVVNSLQGADWHVTFQAFNSNRLTDWNGIDVVYKAIMSDSHEDAKDRLQVSGPVFNTAGELVATGAADLWDGSIVNSIQYDEFGNSVQNPEVWTGTFAVGTSAGNHCGDWTGSGGAALYGNHTFANAGWLDAGLRVCTGSAHIYGMSPPIALDAPAEFNITAPIDTIAESAPTVSWEQAAWAVSYDVTVADDESCSNVVQSYSNVVGAAQTLISLDDGTYYTCVTANNPTGSTSATNNGLAFTIQSAPGSFEILSPTGTITEATPTVSWQAAIGANSYDLSISSTSDCTSTVQSYPGLAGTSQTVSELASGTYYSCVTAQNAVGVTAADNQGLPFTVETASTTGHVVWVSSTGYSISSSTQFPPPFGVVNSLQGADWHVTFQAFNTNRLTDWNGIDVVYKAIMSDSNEDAKDRLQVSGPVFNTAGELVATGAADLWDGSIVNSIQYDEFGNSVQNPEVWTGTLAVGTSDGNHCGDWNGSGGAALYGNHTFANAGWLDFGVRTCAGSAHIYGMSPPIALDAPAAFNITAPTDTIAESAPTVSWEQAAWAVSYDVTVANDESCSDVVQSYSNVVGAAQTLTSLDDGTYYTCVTANNPTGSTSATNNGLAFTIQSVPGSFEILSPTGTITETTPTVSWQAATAADSSHEVGHRSGLHDGDRWVDVDYTEQPDWYTFAGYLRLSANYGKQVDSAWEDGEFDARGKADFDDFILPSVRYRRGY